MNQKRKLVRAREILLDDIYTRMQSGALFAYVHVYDTSVLNEKDIRLEREK